MEYRLMKNNLCKYIIEIKNIIRDNDNVPISVNFTVYKPYTWIQDEPSDKHFVADVYWKWDNCTHWNFYGEDYDFELPDNDINNAYYHICGSYSISDAMRMFAFVRSVMIKILCDTTQDYSKDDEEIDMLLLKDYEIIKKE